MWKVQWGLEKYENIRSAQNTLRSVDEVFGKIYKTAAPYPISRATHLGCFPWFWKERITKSTINENLIFICWSWSSWGHFRCNKFIPLLIKISTSQKNNVRELVRLHSRSNSQIEVHKCANCLDFVNNLKTNHIFFKSNLYSQPFSPINLFVAVSRW